MKNSIILFGFLVMCACSKEKGSAITQQNVREVLTQYAKDHTENEVIIETKEGTMRLKLYDETPLHRANFVKLIKEGYYDENDFYRVVDDFMIQGGNRYNPLAYRIPSEFSTKYFHKNGALSMARVDENNPNKESSSSEFFIVDGSHYEMEELESEAKYLGLHLTSEQKDIYISKGGSMDLDQKYTVFGEVIAGLDVIELIAKQQKPGTETPRKKIPFTIKVVESNK